MRAASLRFGHIWFFATKCLPAINYINDNDAAIKPRGVILKHKGIVAAAGLTTKEVTDRFHIPKKALNIWTCTGRLSDCPWIAVASPSTER